MACSLNWWNKPLGTETVQSVRSEAIFGRILFQVGDTSFVAVRIEDSADASMSANGYPRSMEKKIIVVLIVTRSIPLSDGLDALLRAIPQIDEVHIVRNIESAFQQVVTGKPRIILIDAVLFRTSLLAALQKMQKLSAEMQRVLLVDDVEKSTLLPKHAEAILIKGAPPSALTAIVSNLLLGKGEEHEHNDSNEQEQSVP